MLATPSADPTAVAPRDPLVAAGIALTDTCVADAIPLAKLIGAQVPPERQGAPTGPLYLHVLWVGRHEGAARQGDERDRTFAERQVLHGYPHALAAMRTYLIAPPPNAAVATTVAPAPAGGRLPRHRLAIPRARPAAQEHESGHWVWHPRCSPSLSAAERATPLGLSILQPRRVPLTIDDGMQATVLCAVMDAEFRDVAYPRKLARFSAKVLELVEASRRGGKAFVRLEAKVRKEYPGIVQEARLALEALPRPDGGNLAEAYVKYVENYKAEDPTAHGTDVTASSSQALSPVRPSPTMSVPARHNTGPLTVGTALLIPILDVHVDPERRRRADVDHVAALAESISASGLNQPIVVTPKGELVAGLHRLLAHEKLGIADIAAYVRDISGHQKRLAEIDENLVRRQLPALELAELTSERKQIYETLHPETQQHRRGGVVKASRAATATIAVAESFAAETAKKTGVAERTIRMYAQVAGIAPAAKEAIRSTPVAGRINELVALAHVPAEDQGAVARAISDGKAKRVSEAYEVLRAARGPAVLYAVTQGPVIQRQRVAVKRLHDDLQATADAWCQHDAVGMKPFIEHYNTTVMTLKKALDAAPADVPAEACRCGGRSSCARCGGRGWVSGEKKSHNKSNAKK